jgi:hypothetical protein
MPLYSKPRRRVSSANPDLPDARPRPSMLASSAEGVDPFDVPRVERECSSIWASEMWPALEIELLLVGLRPCLQPSRTSFDAVAGEHRLTARTEPPEAGAPDPARPRAEARVAGVSPELELLTARETPLHRAGPLFAPPPYRQCRLSVHLAVVASYRRRPSAVCARKERSNRGATELARSRSKRRVSLAMSRALSLARCDRTSQACSGDTVASPVRAPTRGLLPVAGCKRGFHRGPGPVASGMEAAPRPSVRQRRSPPAWRRLPVGAERPRRGVHFRVGAPGRQSRGGERQRAGAAETEPGVPPGRVPSIGAARGTRSGSRRPTLP